MSEERIYPSDEPEPLKQQVDLIVDELVLAFLWNRPATIMVAYDSGYTRADSLTMLENRLIDQRQKITWVHAGEKKNTVRSWMKMFESSSNTVLFVDGVS